jgi:hypothetical protein
MRVICRRVTVDCGLGDHQDVSCCFGSLAAGGTTAGKFPVGAKALGVAEVILGRLIFDLTFAR